uniref:Uncharacterized protein n=1 Tax=Tanacetum cinerariifolium TaxID=118510 RepID=A0A6L2JX89_TANCI|nr:hypothetical protein [Tanacetum cinerariifolium]
MERSRNPKDYMPWMRVDAMIKGWLATAMEKNIRNSVKYAGTASEIWSDLNERFGKESAPRAYELKQKITSTQQAGDTAIDVAATFGVPLITVGDLHTLINDIEVGKHDELLSEMTNDDRMETMDALGTICNSIQADNINADVTTGAKDQPKVNSNFRTLVADLVFNDVNISIPRKIVEKGRSRFARCLIEESSKADLVDVVTIGIPSLYEDGFTKETIRVMSPPIVTISNVVTPTIEKTNDGFQTVSKKKKRKGKSKSTNGGQFADPSVKQNIRYEPKENTSAPKKGVTNVGNTSQSSSMLMTTDKSSKKYNLSMSNSFSALNDEEDVENVYDKSSNLIQNTNAGGSSYFTAADG